MSRFNFGVPLEDIFPPNDLHPRLRFLFEEAYKLYISNSFSIEQTVRQLQGSLETRLNLKRKVINDAHYEIKTKEVEQAPGTYFWLIRHFLGLLPIPLLPSYAQGIRFKWITLSRKCRIFLRNYESEHEKKHTLDYEFAEQLNLLPFEHFLLLTILVNFIRKLSRTTTNGQINRGALLFLSKYYYASTCIRPYIPGHKEEKMFPMFFYIVLRWREIEKLSRILGHPAYFLESNCLNYETYQGFSIRDNWAQTNQNFQPKVITIYKNIPYFADNNNYLKDISCQTEQANVVDCGTQNSDVKYEKEETNGEFKHETISDVKTCSLYPSLPQTSSPIKEDQHDDTEVNFFSTDDASNNLEWSEIVKETKQTIKKVEEYIYDDYDTFSKEEYNQISDKSKDKGYFRSKVSKIGWTYTPENSAREEIKVETSDENESNNTYVKFEEIFDESGKYKTNGDGSKSDVRENSLNVVFNKYNDSKIPLCTYSGRSSKEKNEIEEGKSKKNFNLKRFKLKLDFLRMLTPKRVTGSTPSYDSIESKVKYKKIKNIKSNTL